jgi:hypothetical protein
MQSSLLEEVIKGINIVFIFFKYSYTPRTHIIKETAAAIMLTFK